MTPTRVLSSMGRTLDLSKLTVLTSGTGGSGKSMLGATGGGNVVMLTESPHTTSSSSVLVPFSGVAPSPITILPLGTNTTTTTTARTASDCNSSGQCLAVIPKMSAPSACRQTLTQQQVKVTGPKLTTYTVPSGRKRPDGSVTAPKPPKIGKVLETPSTVSLEEEEDDALTPAKILELPIIFAKDDDSLFTSSKSEPEVLSTPIVVPIDASSEGSASSVLTTGDTISFPLEDDITDQTSNFMKPTTAAAVPAQNVVLIKSGNSREKANTIGGRPVLQKTQRILHTIGKVTAQKQPLPNQPAGLKYTKIILTNRHPSLKVAGQESHNSHELSVVRNKLESIEIEAPSEVTMESSLCIPDVGVEDLDVDL